MHTASVYCDRIELTDRKLIKPDVHSVLAEFAMALLRYKNTLFRNPCGIAIRILSADLYFKSAMVWLSIDVRIISQVVHSHSITGKYSRLLWRLWPLEMLSQTSLLNDKKKYWVCLLKSY